MSLLKRLAPHVCIGLAAAVTFLILTAGCGEPPAPVAPPPPPPGFKIDTTFQVSCPVWNDGSVVFWLGPIVGQNGAQSTGYWRINIEKAQTGWQVGIIEDIVGQYFPNGPTGGAAQPATCWTFYPTTLWSCSTDAAHNNSPYCPQPYYEGVVSSTGPYTSAWIRYFDKSLDTQLYDGAYWSSPSYGEHCIYSQYGSDWQDFGTCSWYYALGGQ